MELKVLLMGPAEKERDIEKIVREFLQSMPQYVVDVAYKKLGEEDGRELFGIKANVAGETNRPDQREDLYVLLFNRIVALGLKRGFVPLDGEGKIIYLQPPYGFEVVFYSPQTGRGDDMFSLVRTVYRELGDHIDDGHVGSRHATDGKGEYFIVQLQMQDYLTLPERQRLMLAAYFRLLLLARQNGFKVVEMDDNEARNVS